VLFRNRKFLIGFVIIAALVAVAVVSNTLTEPARLVRAIPRQPKNDWRSWAN